MREHVLNKPPLRGRCNREATNQGSFIHVPENKKLPINDRFKILTSNLHIRPG